MKYQYEIFGDCWSILKKFLESKKNALHAASLSYAAPHANSLDSNDTPTMKFKPATRKGGRKVGERRKSTKALREAKLAKSAKRLEQQLEEEESVSSVSTLDEGSQGFASDNQPPIGPRVIEEKGIQLPINIEGGCCAAIIGLMATRRVIFDITIPDQMILIDNQTQEKAEKNKLLEKVKMHEMISGRKFVLPEELGSAIDEDIYTEKDDDNESDAVMKETEDGQGNVTGELLQTEETTEVTPKENANLQDDSVDVNDPLSSVESTDNEDAARTNSASLENVSNKRKYFSEEEDSPIWSKKIKVADRKESEEPRFSTLSESEAGPSKEDEDSKPKQPKIQTSSSRIRMYMMREQMDDSDIISYWAFDNIFINTCEISCRLRNSPEVESSLSSLSPGDVANTFMPVSQKRIAEALALRKRVVLHDWTKLEPVLATWEEEGRSPSFVNLVKRLFEFIESKKDLGASATEIKEAFAFPECDDVPPLKVICEMEEVKLVLKVGVETFRWVTIQYAKTWLIRTNKMSRSKMNSSEPVRLTGVYEVKGTEKAQNSSDSLETPETSSNSATKDEVVDVGKSKKENGSNTEEKSNLQNIRPRLALLKSRYRRDTEAIDNVEKALDQHLAKSRHEEIDVLVRPWVRLNGCLNRRVMDRMLGAILCFVMEYPGTSGYEIADKFWPALQPAHTYELLETLVVIEAVSKFYIRKSHKVTLFSEPQELTVEPAEDFDTEDRMNYEAEVDCVLKLSMFIGDKKYSQDFLTKCR